MNDFLSLGARLSMNRFLADSLEITLERRENSDGSTPRRIRLLEIELMIRGHSALISYRIHERIDVKTNILAADLDMSVYIFWRITGRCGRVELKLLE